MNRTGRRGRGAALLCALLGWALGQGGGAAAGLSFTYWDEARGVQLTVQGNTWTRLQPGEACAGALCVSAPLAGVLVVQCIRAPCPPQPLSRPLVVRDARSGAVLSTPPTLTHLQIQPMLLAAARAEQWCVSGPRPGVVCTDGRAQVWRLAGGPAVALTPDGSGVVLAVREPLPAPDDWATATTRVSLRVLSLDGQPRARLEVGGSWSVERVTVLRGSLLLTLSNQSPARMTAYRHLLVDPTTLTMQADLTGLDPAFASHPFVQASADGSLVAGGVNTLALYRRAPDATVRRLWAVPLTAPPERLVFSEDGKQMLVCEGQAAPRVLEATTGRSLGSTPPCPLPSPALRVP